MTMCESIEFPFVAAVFSIFMKIQSLQCVKNKGEKRQDTQIKIENNPLNVKKSLNKVYRMKPSQTVVLIGVVLILWTLLPIPFLYLAKVFNVDVQTLQGSGFKVTLLNIAIVLSFSLSVIVFILGVQCYLHKRPIEHLGFQTKKSVMWLLLGHGIGFFLSALQVGLSYVFYGGFRISWAVPAETPLSTCLGYYFFS